MTPMSSNAASHAAFHFPVLQKHDNDCQSDFDNLTEGGHHKRILAKEDKHHIDSDVLTDSGVHKKTHGKEHKNVDFDNHTHDGDDSRKHTDYEKDQK